MASGFSSAALVRSLVRTLLPSLNCPPVNCCVFIARMSEAVMRVRSLVVSILLASFLAALLVSPVAGQAKHPFTFEDMMKLKRVGEPVPSPDGKWVLFSVVDVDLAANKKTPHIWIVPLAGGQEREIIADQDGDRPRWSPDGKRFAFISTKTHGAQVWLADFESSSGTVTNTWILTLVETEAGGELWSPDGKNILFTSDVYPECDGPSKAEDNCNRKQVEESKQSKVKALVFDHLLYRHWNVYKEGKRTHILVVPVPAEIPSKTVVGFDDMQRPRDLTPGDYDAPVFSLGGQDNYAFSPDGQEICYTSNHDKVEATSTNNDLWTVPVNWPANATPADVLAKTKNITADNPASDSTPLYSPDGKYIAYRAQQRPGYESDRFRLMLYERKTGEKKSLTESFDRWVGSYVWSPDSDGIFFSAEQEGESPIFMSKFDDNGGNPSLIFHGFNDDLALVKTNSGLLFTRVSVARPTEIFREELATDHNLEPSRLTNVNGNIFSSVEQNPITSFWFTGAHGDKVQGFLCKPPT